jgi:hypothetical protein
MVVLFENTVGCGLVPVCYSFFLSQFMLVSPVYVIEHTLTTKQCRNYILIFLWQVVWIQGITLTF